MNGWLFLAIVSLITLAVFLNGLRFSRMTKSPFASAGMTPKQLQRAGKFQMLAAPILWLLFALMIFGVFGPVEGVSTIKFV